MRWNHLSVLSVALVCLSFTACVSPGDETVEEEDRTIELTFWHQEQVESRVAVLQELLDKFHEQNPNITVTQQTMTWDEQFAKLMSAIEAGNPPDIAWGTEHTTVTLWNADAIKPVTDIVQSLDASYSYQPAHLWRLQWDGDYWGIPIFGLSYNLWYNRSHFEEADIDPPENWSELLDAAETLNSPPDRWGMALPTSATFYGDQVVANFLFNNAGAILGSGSEPLLKSPEFEETLEFYARLSEFTPPDSSTYEWPEAGQAFAQGRSSMLSTYNAVLDWEKVGNDPSDLGIAPFPHDRDAETRTLSYTLNMMVLTDDGDKREAIKKLLEFMMEPENYGLWAAEFEAGLFLPITEAGLDSETYWDHELVNQYSEQIRTAIQLTENNTAYGFLKGEQPDPGLGPLTGGHVLADAAQKVMNGEMTSGEAATWAQEGVADLLAKEPQP
jgi:multiple sugar transport system substrate-binding protein